MVRLWYGKLNLAKPYLALATQQSRSRLWFSSRRALSYDHHHHSLRDNRTCIQNQIVGEKPRIVSSNVTIETFDSLCDQGNAKDAVEVLNCLEKKKGYALDLYRLLRLAKLCGETKALEEAKVVHECIVALVSPFDVRSRNVIMEMYSVCGSVNDAWEMFEEMPKKDLESWCVMMRCFVSNGYGDAAIDLFIRFKQEGNKPDGEIFKEVFAACGLIGDVEEGSLQFEAMCTDYEIVPSMEHYHSVTKMLATSGYLDEALDFVMTYEQGRIHLIEGWCICTI